MRQIHGTSTENGMPAAESKPLRMCVACREMKHKDTLIKVTKNKNGTFTVGSNSDGRGAYVCKNAECIKKCRKTKGFNRAFKGEVPAHVYNLTEELFEQNG